MIRFDLILIFRQGAQNVWWYWHTAEEAVSWARNTFPDVREIQISWSVGADLKIQEWKSEPYRTVFPDMVVEGQRWKRLEID